MLTKETIRKIIEADSKYNFLTYKEISELALNYLKYEDIEKMREIKFRAYLKDFKEMKYLIGIVNFHEKNITIFCNDLNTTVMTRDCNIMQYTGIKDKNGKEIYEGDICSVDDYPDMLGMYGEYGIVEFKGVSFGMTLVDTKRFVSIQDEEIEVIGNIHEATEEQLKEWGIEK
jgi:uncharacterized phage protein (TIGR01671 family)